MNEVPTIDRSAADERALTDRLRQEHAVARTPKGEWVLLRHEDVVAAAEDDRRFSSAVSAHLQIPNGLDGTEHEQARRLIDAYLSGEALEPFVPRFATVAQELVAQLPRQEPVEIVGGLGTRFAVRAMTQWLGWDPEMESDLVAWMAANHEATRSGDRQRTDLVAQEFDEMIREVLAIRRRPGSVHDDVTATLMADRTLGRELTDEELVSILRNWTGGDLGSMALCVGVVVDFLARHPEIQSKLRSPEITADQVDAIIDEILRIDDPFVSNRRRTTCPVTVSGVDIPSGEIVRLHWTSANRDEHRFGDPSEFNPDQNRDHNLVYGVGRHACPGRLLSTLELRCMVNALMAGTTLISPVPHRVNEREITPVGGYRQVWVCLS